MKHIAVLMTVYNRREKTLKCLRNLFNQRIPTDFSLDVYLTNDGCKDGTPEALRSEFPQVRIIEGDGSLFWNRGMHGLKQRKVIMITTFGLMMIPFFLTTA